MVLSNDLVLLPADDVSLPSHQAMTAAANLHTAKDQSAVRREMAHVPVPVELVRTSLREYEDECVRLLLLRYSGADVLPNGWRAGPQSHGVRVEYGEVEGSDWYTMRTVGRLEVSAEKAANVLMPCETTPRFDDMTREVRLVEKLSDATEVRLVFCKSVMFTSPRGLCVTTTMQRQRDGRIVIVTRSVEHPDGAQPGYVRAVSYISGYVLTPDPENPKACEVAMIAHMDLGGSLPAMVLRFVGLSAPIKMVRKMQDLMLTV